MNINLFMKLVEEDYKACGSQQKLADITQVGGRTVINHWMNEIKSPPSYEKLNTYVSNIDVPKERKRLYYEYCGYPVPPELSDLPTIKPEDLANFAGYPEDYGDETPVPIIGEVQAGLTCYADEDIIGYEYVPKRELSPSYSYVFLRVRGDSMNVKGIIDGSLVLIAIGRPPEDGKVVVAIIDNENATVKQYKDKGKNIMLSPVSTNLEHEPFIFPKRSDEYRIYGVVQKVVTNL